mgnify:CR=1 FL=1|tara:strand:- start:372 stop:845 length:474 start_codon:yes stop_codon:yes gene_type:complete
MNQVISNSIGLLNNSSLFNAFITLIMNLGSRYISIDLCNFQEKILSSFIVRKLCIFAIFWMATRDIILSLLLTILFTFIVSGLFNSNSFLCILPKKTIKDSKSNNISIEQYQQAKKIIQDYELLQKNNKYQNNPDKNKEYIYKYNKWLLNKKLHTHN